MDRTLKFYRPIAIARPLTGDGKSPVIETITFRPRQPGDEADNPMLAGAVARLMRDADGTIPTEDDLRPFALAEGIKAAFRPYFEGML